MQTVLSCWMQLESSLLTLTAVKKPVPTLAVRLS